MLDAGLCNYVVISYGHNALSSDSMTKMLMDLGGDDSVFGQFGAASGYAMAARRAMHTFHTGPETWKHIAVGERKWANLNPRAMMHKRKMTFEDYYNSKPFVDPFRLYDSCLMTDGGRAIVVTTEERARDLKHTPAVIMGMGQHNTATAINYSTRLAGPTAAKKSGEMAFNMAGITLDDIDACEIYDCFTYTVEINLQSYGFFGPGEGEDWLKGGTIEPGGRMPVNTSGGQLSETYFMGLTSISEGAMQLMGRCGDRQLGHKTNTKEPEIILCSDSGGVSRCQSTFILRRG